MPPESDLQGESASVWEALPIRLREVHPQSGFPATAWPPSTMESAAARRAIGNDSVADAAPTSKGAAFVGYHRVARAIAGECAVGDRQHARTTVVDAPRR